MVFSSVPLYLDPPNWQQQVQNPNELQNPQLRVGGGGRGGVPPATNKPISSMGERARLAKVPAAEGPLRCPRPGCESTNTKFCYFNNYNLSQPRHFCKACRRYWTRGGALRNVPVGGACRRNKRRKSGGARSKSPATAAASEGHKAASQPQQHHQPADQRLFHPVGPVSAPPYSFMASLQSLTSLGMGNLGQLGYAAAQPAQQQLSLLAGFGAAPSSSASGYPFQLSEGGLQETASFGKEMGMMGARAGAGQLSLSRPLLGGGVTENMGQFWSAHINNAAAGAGSGGLWTDLSGMNN